MVVAISAERYRAICFPLSLRQNPAKYIAFVLFLSFTLELPRWFEFKHSYVNDTHYETYTTTAMMEDPAYISFSSWNDIISVGFVPLFALVFYNSRIYLKIRASPKFEHRHVGSASVMMKGISHRKRSSAHPLASVIDDSTTANTTTVGVISASTTASTTYGAVGLANSPSAASIDSVKQKKVIQQVRPFFPATIQTQSFTIFQPSSPQPLRPSAAALASQSSAKFKRKREKTTIVLGESIDI